MKKTLLLILSLVLGLITACSNGESNSTENAVEGNEQPKELKDVSIMLDWYPNAVHSYLYVAQ